VTALLKKIVSVRLVCGTAEELPFTERNPAVLCDCVSCSASWFQTNSNENWIHQPSEYCNSQQHVLFLISGVTIPFPFGHFVTFCCSVILLCFSVSLFPTFTHSAAPGSVSPFLGQVFFLTSYISWVYFSCPLWTLLWQLWNNTGGFQRRRKDSKLHSLHYSSSSGELKRKWRAKSPLKWTPPRGLPVWHVGSQPACTHDCWQHKRVWGLSESFGSRRRDNEHVSKKGGFSKKLSFTIPRAAGWNATWRSQRRSLKPGKNLCCCQHEPPLWYHYSRWIRGADCV